MKKKLFVVTLFPEYFDALKAGGVVGQALRGERSIEGFDLELIVINPRDFTNTNYKGVDDSPYGGGAGMVLRADVLATTINDGIIEQHQLSRENLHVIYTAPRGVVWNNEQAKSVAVKYFDKGDSKQLVFICGRYEGVDERFLENYVDQFFSLGDFILSGGEIPVLAMIDSALRFAPGVLGNKVSAEDESFANNLLEYPQYTRPREFEGKEVPEVLTSGHHKKIISWQEEQSLEMTKKYRPDLIEKNNGDKEHE